MCLGRAWVFIAIYTCPIAPGGRTAILQRNNGLLSLDELPFVQSMVAPACVGDVGFCTKYQKCGGKHVPWGLCSSVCMPANGPRPTTWYKPSPRHFGLEKQKGVKMITRTIMPCLLWRIERNFCSDLCPSAFWLCDWGNILGRAQANLGSDPSFTPYARWHCIGHLLTLSCSFSHFEM